MLTRSKTIFTESIEDKLRLVAQKLKNVVFKMSIKFDPISFQFLGDSGKPALTLEVEAGKLEVKIDDIYTKSHFVKFMGLNLQAKDQLVILGALVSVSAFVLPNA